MDPLAKFDFHELFFQHLTTEEILEVSLVSSGWNKAVGSSRAAMKKVWLNVGDRFNEPTREDLKAFRTSDRKYQNFKMSEIENGLQILLFPRRQWKRAQLDIQSFVSYKDFVNLLKIFNESIVELEIFDMDVECAEYEDESFQFPCLEKLRIGFVTSNCLQPFLQHLPKLKKVQLDSIRDQGTKGSESRSELMVKFLKHQSRLTHLSLTEEASECFFKHSDSFEFYLVFLLLEQKENCEINLDNFRIFMKEQTRLQSITLSEWTCSESLAFVLMHGNITRISFNYFDENSRKFDSSHLEAKEIVNQRVQRIDFEVENCVLSWVEPILRSCPNVNELYFFHVDETLFDYLIINLKFLKTLEYASIFDGYSLKTNSKFQAIETKYLDFNKLF